AARQPPLLIPSFSAFFRGPPIAFVSGGGRNEESFAEFNRCPDDARAGWRIGRRSRSCGRGASSHRWFLSPVLGTVLGGLLGSRLCVPEFRRGQTGHERQRRAGVHQRRVRGHGPSE